MPANSKANHLLPQSRDESTNGEQPEITETQCRIRIMRDFIIWFLGEDCFCVFLFCPIKRTHYIPLLATESHFRRLYSNACPVRNIEYCLDILCQSGITA